MGKQSGAARRKARRTQHHGTSASSPLPPPLQPQPLSLPLTAEPPLRDTVQALSIHESPLLPAAVMSKETTAAAPGEPPTATSPLPSPPPAAAAAVPAARESGEAGGSLPAATKTKGHVTSELLLDWSDEGVKRWMAELRVHSAPLDTFVAALRRQFPPPTPSTLAGKIIFESWRQCVSDVMRILCVALLNEEKQLPTADLMTARKNIFQLRFLNIQFLHFVETGVVMGDIRHLTAFSSAGFAQKPGGFGAPTGSAPNGLGAATSQSFGDFYASFIQKPGGVAPPAQPLSRVFETPFSQNSMSDGDPFTQKPGGFGAAPTVTTTGPVASGMSQLKTAKAEKEPSTGNGAAQSHLTDQPARAAGGTAPLAAAGVSVSFPAAEATTAKPATPPPLPPPPSQMAVGEHGAALKPLGTTSSTSSAPVLSAGVPASPPTPAAHVAATVPASTPSPSRAASPFSAPAPSPAAFVPTPASGAAAVGSTSTTRQSTVFPAPVQPSSAASAVGGAAAKPPCTANPSSYGFTFSTPSSLHAAFGGTATKPTSTATPGRGASPFSAPASAPSAFAFGSAAAKPADSARSSAGGFTSSTAAPSTSTTFGAGAAQPRSAASLSSGFGYFGSASSSASPSAFGGATARPAGMSSGGAAGYSGFGLSGAFGG